MKTLLPNPQVRTTYPNALLNDQTSEGTATRPPETFSAPQPPPLILGSNASGENDLLQQKQSLIEPYFMKRQVLVDPGIRANCVELLIRANDLLNFLPDTLFLAVSLMDQYLQVRVVASLRRMELLWVSSLYVAAKYKESLNYKKWHFIMVTAHILRDTKKAGLLDMEKDIFRAVDWTLERALPLDFLRHICEKAEASTEEEITAMYILEVCLMDYQMAWVKPSQRAAAAAYCSFMLLGRSEDCWDDKMESHSGHSIFELPQLVTRMAQLTLDAREKAKSAPYAQGIHDRVSYFSESKIDKLRQMARYFW